MAVLLAAVSALGYGLSDFVGGLVSRRASPWSVAFLGQLCSAGCTALVALFWFGDTTGPDLSWGSAAGVAGGIGTVFLYRGLASGRMGVVAPVSAVGSALVPVVAGAASGERPGTLVWLGVLAALPGIWLTSREPSHQAATTSATAGLFDGVLAGCGFGLMFAALGQVPEAAGLWPLALTQVASVVTVVLVALVIRTRWLPRERYAWWGVAAGPLGASAALAFLFSAQQGYLTVAGVIAALYPAATVVLAMAVLRERVHRVQALGLALCAAAVGLVAAG